MEAEKKNAVLVSVSPMAVNSNTPEGFSQHGYVSKAGQKIFVYEATVKFKDGTVVQGEVGGTTPVKYRFNNGSEVLATITEDSRAYGGHKFKIDKVITAADKAGGSSYNNPENNLKMAYSMARTHASNTYIKLLKMVEDREKYYALVNLYLDWITNGHTLSDRDHLSRRWYILQDAVTGIESHGLKSTSEIIALADEFAQHEQNT